jgi:hypothetical protein
LYLAPFDGAAGRIFRATAILERHRPLRAVSPMPKAGGKWNTFEITAALVVNIPS